MRTICELNHALSIMAPDKIVGPELEHFYVAALSQLNLLERCLVAPRQSSQKIKETC